MMLRVQRGSYDPASPACERYPAERIQSAGALNCPACATATFQALNMGDWIMLACSNPLCDVIIVPELGCLAPSSP